MNFNFKSIDDLPDADKLVMIIDKVEKLQRVETRVMNSINRAINHHKSETDVGFPLDEFDDDMILMVSNRLRQKGYETLLIESGVSYKVKMMISWNTKEGETK
ncbi:hypothetical protein [Limosilactobacillus ingluviei]|uniref:hypothetical protein n=1 Tax=Limosilactobacillus ingluviei TaxID=148604 RepID=UPI000704C802|nr:hypothetical protein [Limosilactobacillus ingluviei]